MTCPRLPGGRVVTWLLVMPRPRPCDWGQPDGRWLQDNQGQHLGSAGAGQLPDRTARVYAGGVPESGQAPVARARGTPSRALADGAFSLPGSVSMVKSLLQKLLLSQSAP